MGEKLRPGHPRLEDPQANRKFPGPRAVISGKFILPALAAILIAAGCSKKNKTDQTALYRQPDGLFSCQAPSSWRVSQSEGGAQLVSFYGPSSGTNAYSASISYYFYSKSSKFSRPEDFFRAQTASAGQLGPLENFLWKGVKIYEFRRDTSPMTAASPASGQDRLEDTVLIPVGGGFLAVVYSSAADAYGTTEPLFRKMLDSLQI
jgi:hypothetical protein